MWGSAVEPCSFVGCLDPSLFCYLAFEETEELRVGMVKYALGTKCLDWDEELRMCALTQPLVCRL